MVFARRALDPGESFPQAAIREAREETGLDVRLTRFVGSYTRPNWSAGTLYHIHLFAAQAVGGELSTSAFETLDARYFPLAALPERLVLGHRHRIQDVANGLTGVVKTELAPWPFPGLDRWALYRRRDKSGLSRAAFHEKYFPPLTTDQIVVEFPGVKI